MVLTSKNPVAINWEKDAQFGDVFGCGNLDLLLLDFEDLWEK